MIILFPIGALLLICCIWVFFKKVPRSAKKLYILVYNFIAFFAVLILSSYFAYNSYNNIMDTVDRGWAPVTTSISFGFIFLVGIILAFIIRNFLLFRNRK